MREEHAHRRLGFADAEIDEWCSTAGLAPAEPHRLPGDALTVVIWTATRGPAAAARQSAAGLRDPAPAAALAEELR